MRACLVTALVELAPGVPGASRRSVDEYLNLGASVLAIELPMVVFCDESLMDIVRRRREVLAPGHQTEVLPFSPPHWDDDRRFLASALEQGRTASTSNRVKDTADYVALGWAKPSLLRIAADFVDADRYWWVDLGIAHVAAVPEQLGIALCVDTRTLDTSSMHMVSLAKNEWHRTGDNFARVVEGARRGDTWWWQHGAQVVCGGVIGIDRHALAMFEEWTRGAVAEARAHGAAVTDEMLFSRLAAAHPAEVRTTPSSYPSLLEDLVAALVPSLGVLCSSSVRAALPGPAHPDRAALNPSIANDPAGGYRVIVRHANYRYENGHYTPLDGSNDIVTDNVVVRLDEHLAVQSTWAIDDSLVRTVPPRYGVHGLEDMRLFRFDGAWWASATIREHRDDGLCQIVLVELEDEPSEHVVRVVSGVLTTSPVPGRTEKNWAPVEESDRLRFVWQAEPAVLIEVDDLLQATVLSRAVPAVTESSSARGGSQAIRFGDGWLSVVHIVHWVRNVEGEAREYRHRIIRYDRNWRVVARSAEFFFEHRGIEFCAGVARWGDGIVMSYGVEDRVAHLMAISGSDLHRLLVAEAEPAEAVAG